MFHEKTTKQTIDSMNDVGCWYNEWFVLNFVFLKQSKIGELCFG